MKKIRPGGDLSQQVEEKVQNFLHIRHFSPFSSVSRMANVSGEEDMRVSNAPQTRVDPPHIGPYPKLTNPQDPQYLGPQICKSKSPRSGTLRVNYLAVATAIVGFSLVTHPFSLAFLLCLLASWLFLYLFRPSDQPVVILGRTFSDRETLGCLILFSIFVVFLTDVGSVLVSAVMVGVALICAHGAFRAPEDLFLDEQEPAATGFLSFLGGAASSAAPAVIAARG
ncbi:hypothetical protein F2Q68_00001616 [Brassica cretica]|uniref:PRA1 family protein n=1 Tax=Brassica cretica TaxID=69181 RepID=A0A8S9J829_BRACR|nr:hypothetical protein F2Q68_00001616 [Brassica cretica]